MSILNNLKVYADKWQVKSVDIFEDDDINNVASATVVESDYGDSVCFVLVSGGMVFMPVSNTSDVTPGQVLSRDDLRKAKILTLERKGDNDIQRIEI